MMDVVFFSHKELVLDDTVPPHNSVSSAYCAVVLHDNVRPALHCKHKHLLQSGVITFLQIK